jgi:hypothetical protein
VALYKSASERRASTSERQRASDDRYLHRLKARYPVGPCPVEVPLWVWIMSGIVVADQSGHAAIIYLSRCKNRTAAAVIEQAALCLDGPKARRFTAERSRRIAAIGLALVHLAHYRESQGSWRGVVWGIPQSWMVACLRNQAKRVGTDDYGRPIYETPTRSALIGYHSQAANPWNGQAGYLRVLEWAGLFECYRPSWERALPVEKLGEHGTLNRYIIVGHIEDSEDREPVIRGNYPLETRVGSTAPISSVAMICPPPPSSGPP